jgi:hypothetical protein
MKKIIYFAFLAVLLASCGQSANQTTDIASSPAGEINEGEVIVYYFHGKQRCKTCLTIQEVASKTVNTHFTENEKVKFVEIDFSDSANSSLADKYEVAFSSLVIATTSQHVNLTEAAFANVVGNPAALEEIIVTETNQLLSNSNI